MSDWTPEPIWIDEPLAKLLNRIAAVDGDVDRETLIEIIPDEMVFLNFLKDQRLLEDKEASGIWHDLQSERERMSLNSRSLKELLYREVAFLYESQQQLLGFLQNIVAEVSDDLAVALRDDIERTNRELVLMSSQLDSNTPDASANQIIQDLMKDFLLVVRRSSGRSRDIAALALILRIEYSDIRSYRITRKMAEAIGEDSIVHVLSQIEGEKRQAEQKLGQIWLAVTANAAGAHAARSRSAGNPF